MSILEDAQLLGMPCMELGSTLAFTGNRDNLDQFGHAGRTQSCAYCISLILVSERAVTAWWNSWWSSSPDTLPILIYCGAHGHIPHPPAAPLPGCGSPRTRGCWEGKSWCTHREGRTRVCTVRKHKFNVRSRRVSSLLVINYFKLQV